MRILQTIKVLLLSSVLFLATGVFAQTQSRLHPVHQLVQWELLANSELDEDAFRRMAHVVLERADVEQIEAVLKGKLDVTAYRSWNAEAKKAALKELELSEIKNLSVLPAPIEYFEIPESKLAELGTKTVHELGSAGLGQAQSLIKFSKNGIPHVRWFLHPLADEKASQFAAAFKETLGYRPLATRGFLNFHFTSSRSLVVFRDSYENAVSLKVSLPAGEGPFKSKAIHIKEYSAWARHNAYLADVLRADSTPNMKLLFEPYGIGLMSRSGREDAFLFRDLRDLAKGDKYYLPAFAALNEAVGAKIARMNGSDDPVSFWERNLIDPLAKGMAELRALTGAEHTSPHTQNILVELDKNMRPTGRIVLRDFDFYIDSDVFAKLNKVVSDSNGLTRQGPQIHQFTLRNGLNHLPRWMTDAEYSRWIVRYFDRFKTRFSEFTGISVSEIFRNNEIQKYGGGWSPVRNGDFVTGGTNNFHSIAISSSFQNSYYAWIKQKYLVAASSTQVTPSVATGTEPIARPKVIPRGPPIKNWQDLVVELKTSGVDSLAGRLGLLQEQTERMDLKARKEVNSSMNLYHLPTYLRNATDPATVLELARLLATLDPSYIPQRNISFQSSNAATKANPAELKAMSELIATANEMEHIVKTIREESGAAVFAAVAESESKYRIPYQWLADAFAFRIKRTDDLKLKKALIFGLANIGRGDVTVREFLSSHLSALSQTDAEQVTRILQSSLHVDTICEDLFRRAN